MTARGNALLAGVAIAVIGAGISFEGGATDRGGAVNVAPPRSAAAPSEAKITALIKELGHEKFAFREEARNQLLAIGAPALEVLRKSLKCEDAEIRRAAQALVRQIEARDKLISPPLTVNDLEFTFETDPVWRVSPAGRETKINLVLKATNRGTRDLGFPGGVHVQLAFPDGRSVEKARWRTYYPSLGKDKRKLGPGDTCLVTGFGFRLHRDRESKEIFVQGQEDGGQLKFRKLAPGRYALCVSTHFPANRAFAGNRTMDDGTPWWTGEAVAGPVTIQIK